MAARPPAAGPMKYPPTRVAGWPVSACQRSGSVKVDIGTGTTSTAAEAGRRSAANVADQPAGGGVAATAGNGLGTIGRTARTAQDMTTTAGRAPDASRGRRRAAKEARTGRAASAQKASRAAAAPSATTENRSGSATLSTRQPLQPVPGQLDGGVLVTAGQQGAAERERKPARRR